MNPKNTWKWALVAFLLAWSIWEMNPPTSRDLIAEFRNGAAPTDTNFTRIMARVDELQKTNATSEYANLREAIGTNDIRGYFPWADTKADAEPTQGILNRLQKKASGKIKLGLDLQGGIQFLVSLDTNKMAVAEDPAPPAGTNATVRVTDADRTRAVSQAVEVLRKRVDRFGVAEPVIQPLGQNRIMIQLPGLSESRKADAVEQISKAAYLEFRVVHPDSDRMLKQGTMEPGYEMLKEKRRDAAGNPALYQYVVQKRPALGLTGKYVKAAYPSRDPVTGKPEIHFEFNSRGADLFGQLTTQHSGNLMAIVLDGELQSAPRINEPILGGNVRITGDFTWDEANNLASVLENPLETPVKIDEVREVDPSLGKDSIEAGIRSAVIGTIAVALFMVVYYHRAGVIADIAMVLNLVILMGVMCSVGTTLTLPGIAGIVLTVGMAVDANVLIYERLREEMAAGKSMRGALSAAYSKAFGTIFDSHTTTLISGVILIFFGTGPVKGFGVTLTIGVALSLFTALFVTRIIFDWLLARNWLNTISMLHLIKKPKIDFMRLAKPAFIATWTVIAIGMGYGIFVRGSSVMGVDFAGGDALTLRFSQKVEAEAIRQTLAKADVGEPQIQYQKGLADQKENLQILTKFGSGDKVLSALTNQFKSAGFQVAGRDQVGPTVGIEIQKSAIIASFLSLFGILIYVAFRYEFSFSVGAVLAVIHDVLMTIGIFFVSGRQLSAPMVAAVLTIIGFSINDTIVIFDRIREDLKLGVRGTFKEVMNQALNQTLSRTIITSGTVFLATLSLYLFGGGVINDFAFTFLVGILTGTYSSIYIASALVLWWHKGERPRTASQVSVENAASARVQA
jgi:SecD/SecF fusion protein